MIPEEIAVKMIIETVVIMIHNVSPITETESEYKKQELLEEVIKKLNELI